MLLKLLPDPTKKLAIVVLPKLALAEVIFPDTNKIDSVPVLVIFG